MLTISNSSSSSVESLLSTAKAHRGPGIARLHARQQGYAHQRLVPLLVLHRQPARTAEAQRVRIALLAIVAGDQHAGEVVDPFPGYVVQADVGRVGRLCVFPLVPTRQAPAARFAVSAGRKPAHADYGLIENLRAGFDG